MPISARAGTAAVSISGQLHGPMISKYLIVTPGPIVGALKYLCE
jgi:hypothetical protein